MADPQDRSIVTVSRRWNEPKIIAWMNADEVGTGMSVTDFCTSLAKQIGNPAFILTNAQLQAKILAAATEIQEEMKSHTSKIA